MMNTLNVHLIDYLMQEDFLIRSLYPEDESEQLLVGDFGSEFFSLYKGLSNDTKMEISQSFRKKDIGSFAVRRIHELLKQHQQRPAGLRHTKEGFRQTKNLIVAHLEILYISCRRDKKYSFELFGEFEKPEEWLQMLMEFSDDSTHVNSY